MSPPSSTDGPAKDHPLIETGRELMPGLLVCVTIALATTFLSEHYGGPTLLYALLLGMALHFLSEEGRCVAGIQFAARTILRVGVALLGVRITLEQIMALGLAPVVTMVAAVVLTILAGWLLSRVLGLDRDLGLLTGGAVAICGASAALALSAVMPRHESAERNIILTVVGVTTLSTMAMVIYPILVRSLGLDDTQAGIFLGGTIHDVAQVVGAGYMISPQAGDVSTFVKLLRVAMLVPAVMVFTLLYRRQTVGTGSGRPPLLPGFLLVFVGLVLINSTGVIPAPAVGLLTEVSRWCLITAIAALGLRTSLQKLAVVGWKPVVLMVAETAILAVLVGVSLWACSVGPG